MGLSWERQSVLSGNRLPSKHQPEGGDVALWGPGVPGGSKERARRSLSLSDPGLFMSRHWALSQAGGLAVGFGVLGPPREEKAWGEDGRGEVSSLTCPGPLAALHPLDTGQVGCSPPPSRSTPSPAVWVPDVASVSRTMFSGWPAWRTLQTNLCLIAPRLAGRAAEDEEQSLLSPTQPPPPC